MDSELKHPLSRCELIRRTKALFRFKLIQILLSWSFANDDLHRTVVSEAFFSMAEDPPGIFIIPLGPRRPLQLRVSAFQHQSKKHLPEYQKKTKLLHLHPTTTPNERLTWTITCPLSHRHSQAKVCSSSCRLLGRSQKGSTGDCWLHWNQHAWRSWIAREYQASNGCSRSC